MTTQYQKTAPKLPKQVHSGGFGKAAFQTVAWDEQEEYPTGEPTNALRDRETLDAPDNAFVLNSVHIHQCR